MPGRRSKRQRRQERVDRRDRRRLWRKRVHKLRVGDHVCACGGHGVVREVVYYHRTPAGIVEGPYVPGMAPAPVDADLILEDGRGCSAWHCGTFHVPARYHGRPWCSRCGFTHKDQVVRAMAPRRPGGAYEEQRAFYLACSQLARRGEPWIRKSFQRDLARIRRTRRVRR